MGHPILVDRSSRASRDERRLFHVEVPADDPFELVGDGPAMRGRAHRCS
jgi:hypothetical protein